MSFGYSIGDFIKVIELVKELRSRFVDAPPQYQAIKEELRGLFIVLEDVDAVLPHRTLTNTQRDNFQCLTSTCHHIAEALKDKLSVYQEIDTDRPRAGDETLRCTLRRAWKRIKWEPKDIAELRSRMISSVLLLKEFHAHLNSQRTSEESGLIRDEISEIKTLQLGQERSKEYQEIVEWLTPIEFHSQQNDFYKQRQEGTGQWLLTNPEFNSWLNGTSQALFCPGAPGAGTTSFTSLVVRHLEDRFGHDPGIGITYLYVNYHRREEQEPVSLLASLLKQLIQGQTTVPECVKVYNRHHSRRSRPSLTELMDAYPLVARLYSRIFVLIDALDECECSHGSRRLFLSSVFKLQSATPLNLFATSRHIPEIQTGFERHGSKVLEIRATDSDIQRYVVGRLPQLPTFVLSNHGLQSEVVAQIRNAVDGMFLLAKIHFDSLVAKRSPKAAADARNLANQALAWVVCSRRPLSPLELQHALALEEGATEFDEDNISTIDDILSEYFKQNLVSWVSKVNTIVSTGCITYLSFDEFSTGPCTDVKQYNNRSTQFRLFDYCARNWGHHASDAISAVTDMLIRMLQRDGNRASCWQAVRLQAGQWRQQVQKDWQISAMHLVVDFELAMIVQQLVNEGFPADSRDRKGRTPLSYAASNGNEAITFALLEQNVAVDSKDDDGRTPLSYAASHGYDAIVQILLQRGAEVDSRDHSHYTPLFYAAQKGHNQVVCILLGRDAKPHREDHHGRIPLSHAAWYGRKDVLDLLIQGHQPDIEDRYGRTILSYAAFLTQLPVATKPSRDCCLTRVLGLIRQIALVELLFSTQHGTGTSSSANHS
ncbi:hypothetical protein N8T08_010522 [Aspergillus melleus]|uniref:Uncharacterized protein n=1 Tax=Aspergillus melleus TaxID=138277 RepID=A0ACC3ARC3_9EURO|nr:hypothetical protein N8T08_010522 [Aspergillus melleus]